MVSGVEVSETSGGRNRNRGLRGALPAGSVLDRLAKAEEHLADFDGARGEALMFARSELTQIPGQQQPVLEFRGRTDRDIGEPGEFLPRTLAAALDNIRGD